MRQTIAYEEMQAELDRMLCSKESDELEFKTAKGGFPDYQEIQSTDTRWVNRICPDGNWESNLFQFYQRVLPILQSFLPKPFRLEGNQRISETSAHVAIREALTNTLVHPDYTVNASLCVYKYPNRIVFSNPGTMLIPIRQYYKGGESICRNKYLQTIFTFLGFADKAGSGADKIINGWTAQNWRRPRIEERVQPNKVVLTMTMESLIDDTTKKQLAERFGGREENLSHDKYTALALACSEGEVSNDSLQSVLELHSADITQMLSELCADGFFKGEGYGRGKKYHLPEAGANGTSSNAKVASSEAKVASSEAKVASSKKRYSFSELKLLIVEACQEWCTIDYIVKCTGRNKRYLRNKVLPKLADCIEMMYRDNPTHPKQKYRAKQ